MNPNVIFILSSDTKVRCRVIEEYVLHDNNAIFVCPESLRELLNGSFPIDQDSIALAAAVNMIRNGIRRGKLVVVAVESMQVDVLNLVKAKTEDLEAKIKVIRE